MTHFDAEKVLTPLELSIKEHYDPNSYMMALESCIYLMFDNYASAYKQLYS